MYMLVLSCQIMDWPDFCCNALHMHQNHRVVKITSIGAELTLKNGIEFLRPTFPYHFWKWISQLGITFLSFTRLTWKFAHSHVFQLAIQLRIACVSMLRLIWCCPIIVLVSPNIRGTCFGEHDGSQRPEYRFTLFLEIYVVLW